MDITQAILTRRSIRDWTDQAVSQAFVEKILEAGRYSPSPLNSQPWHFIIVKQKDTIKNLMDYAHHGAFLSHANVLIVLTVEKKATVDDWLTEHEQHILSGACAMQNMWLTAWSMGLGACWVSLDNKMTKDILQIPEERRVLGCLALGYARTKTPPSFARKALSEMVSYEKYEDKRKLVHQFIGKITKIVQETPEVRTFILSKPENFAYKAGQYCLLSFPDQQKINGKIDIPMTISSSPTDANISFTIKKVGEFTEVLFKLKTNDLIQIKGPIGITLSVDEYTKGDLVFLSGGTGIAPFMSILRFIIAKEMKNKVLILNANISRENIIFNKELSDLNSKYENIQVINTLNKPDNNWEGERGFIDKAMIQRHIKNIKEVTWFLCGPPPMIHQLKFVLLEMGVKEERIKIEAYEL